MTIRKPVSVIQNKWHDAQTVDRNDLDVEQNHSDQIDAAIVQNHFGSGVLLAQPQQPTIFDSDNLTAEQASNLAAGNFDGYGVAPHAQPSDTNLGNQLEVELTESTVIGRLSTKVVIIGLDFENNVQSDRMYFYKNETQVTSKHYARILTIMFNDFLGNNHCSRNNGGRIVIREAESFQLSLDPIMVAQDVSPDFFWRDFKVADLTLSLQATIQLAMGSVYSVDALDIDTTGSDADRSLVPNDVTSQIGQKFKAETDNIQKITLALGVNRDGYAAVENRYDWTGDLVISVYPLQTTTSCPTAIVPNLAIDFDPNSTPIVQLSYDQDALRDIGYILTDTLQPVDFVFNSTVLGSGTTSGITVDNYYAVTVKRSGAATSGTIFLGVGTDRIDDSRVTLFSSVWTDVSEEDLWFQVWTDAAKIADGKGYDAGTGMQYDKTTEDEDTGATIDNEIRHKSFTNTGENVLNIGVLQAATAESITEQDERTGNNVNSRKLFTPSFSFVTQSDLNALETTAEPLVIGCMQDTNPKQNALLEKEQDLPGLAEGDTFCIVNPDPDLLSLNLIGSKIIPNYPCSESYRIFNVEFCIDGYGDVNADGVIDSADIAAAAALLGEGLALDSTQQKIIDGYFTTLELLRADCDGDGYITSVDIDLITAYVNRTRNSFPVGTSFTHMCLTLQQSTGRYDGYFDCDGYIRVDGSSSNLVDPSTLTQAELLYDGYLSPVLLETDPVFTAVPFLGVTYRIVPQPYWQPYWVGQSSDARLVPVAFTESTSPTQYDCTTTSIFTCEDRPTLDVECDPGRNDLFVPDNLIMGSGQIVNTDGSYFLHDIEIGTIILKLPTSQILQAPIDVFNKLVADSGDGKTTAGFNAMRYADCSTVQPGDLILNRAKFGVSIKSFAHTDGYDPPDDGYAYDNSLIGVDMDQSTGILYISINDLNVDPVRSTLISRIEIQVFLKKAGWNSNNYLEVDEDQIAGLISS
jgi:hypothetical protein